MFAPQLFMLPVGTEFLTPSVEDVFRDSKDAQDKQDGLLSNSAIPCWVIVTTSTDPEWPVAED